MLNYQRALFLVVSYKFDIIRPGLRSCARLGLRLLGTRCLNIQPGHFVSLDVHPSVAQ